MRHKTVISKDLLQTFIRQGQLSGTVSFLRFIKHKRRLQDFYDFCKKHNYILSEQSSENILFHGSQKLQSLLKPSTSIGQGGKVERRAYVYATDDPNYAIFLAILSLKNGSASVNATKKDTTLVVNLDFVNSLSKLKNGYVHIIADEFFKETTNREYKTDRPVRVLFAVPVTPQDLTVPIYIQTEP